MAKPPAKRRPRKASGRSGRKTAPRKSKGRRRKKSAGKTRRRGYSWPVRLAAVFLLLGTIATLYVLYLDHVVRVKFEGKRWAVPARVFARPLELYPGAPIDPRQFEAELRRLGYQSVRHPDRAGSYSKNRQRYLLRTRPFDYWDGTEASRYLEINFSGDRMAAVADAASGRDLPLARLEAPMIGSIYPSHNEDRVLVQREDLPDGLVKALLATEDRSFYNHHGIDPRAIARALWADIRAGGLVQGGSTLTQQLVKNFYLTRERSLWRKLNEAIMAVLLDFHYGKDEILEAYANEIYLGQDGRRAIHGFGLASYFYFSRPLQELDLPRSVLLVALVRGPSLYDPRRNPERAKKRRDMILGILQEQGAITTQQADRARAAPLGVTGRKQRGAGRYPAFMDLVRRQLQRDYREQDLTSEGLKIFTTLDPWLQGEVEKALSERLQRLEAGHNLRKGILEGAAVVTGREDGEVLAVVGGREARFAGFNRALDALRPIGSLVKPAVYLTALERPEHFTLLTLLDDSAVKLRGADGKPWEPGNYDRKQHGKVPLYQALARSYNLATVKLGMDLGLDAVAARLDGLGVKRPIERLPSMLLGAISLSPLEVAQVYQTLGAGGFYSPLRAIREVLDAQGRPLSRYPLSVSRAAPSGAVYLVDFILQETVRSGTGRSLRKLLPEGLELAGKTGTTNDLRDSWFAGFSGGKVAVVWVGRDDNRPAGLSGSQGALWVWGDIMRHSRPQPLVLLPPDDVESVWIEPRTGVLSAEGCEGARLFPFLKGSAPTVRSSCAEPEERGFIENLFQGWFE